MVFFMRHAHRNVVDSSEDNGLSEKGWLQCKKLEDYFLENKIRIDEIRSSPKLRCVQTSEFVAKIWNLPVQEDWALVEAGSESNKEFIKRVSLGAEKWRTMSKNILLGTHSDVLDVLLRWGSQSSGVSIKKGNLLIWDPQQNFWEANPIQAEISL